MSVINIDNLPRKFQPFLIGSPTCREQIKGEIDDIMNRRMLRPLKSDYIFEADRWVFKLGRTGGALTTPDTHLYRVRKAEKIRTYILQHGLEAHIAVPKKYLYWHTTENQFYLVAEKMALSREVAAPASIEYEDNFKADPSLGGQVEALANDHPKRSLTTVQAKALAEMAGLGYNDLTYNNLHFTNDGKVAIIDTEPLKRFVNKETKSSFNFFFFGDRRLMLTLQALSGIAKLKLYTDAPAALQAVEKVEKNHAIWGIVESIVKISLVTFGCYFFALPLAALIPIAKVAVLLKVGCIGFAVLKNINLTSYTISMCRIWRWSYQGLEGMDKMCEMEKLLAW